MNDFQPQKKVFLLYITSNKRPPTIGCGRSQKYFFNIQWHKEKTFKHLYTENYCKTIKKSMEYRK